MSDDEPPRERLPRQVMLRVWAELGLLGAGCVAGATLSRVLPAMGVAFAGFALLCAAYFGIRRNLPDEWRDT